MNVDVWDSEDEALAVAKRLMGTEEVDREDGRALGRRWAKEAASLRDLLEAVDREFDDDDMLFLRADNSLHEVLIDEGLVPRENYVGQVGHKESAFMLGVLQGAHEVFWAVRFADSARIEAMPS